MRPTLLTCVTLALLVLGCARDLDLPPEPAPPSTGGGCTSDADCVLGICDENAVCDASRCRRDEQCQNGACRQDGFCASRVCESDEECGLEHYCRETPTRDTFCSPGCKTMAHCPQGKECRLGAGLDYGLCYAGNCQTDAECGGCTSCVFDGGSPLGTCSQTPRGPPLQGDPTALTMRDNLQAAVDFVRARAPEAQLIQINGSELKADGSVDITQPNHFVARWMYGFQIGDGSAAPPTFQTVTYLLQGGAQCGLYDPNATNLSQRPFVPDATWAMFQDSPALVTAFTAQTGCLAPAQSTSDSILYDHEGGPRFLLFNWKSQSAIGDAVTGSITYKSCD